MFRGPRHLFNQYKIQSLLHGEVVCGGIPDTVDNRPDALEGIGTDDFTVFGDIDAADA